MRLRNASSVRTGMPVRMSMTCVSLSSSTMSRGPRLVARPTSRVLRRSRARASRRQSSRPLGLTGRNPILISELGDEEPRRDVALSDVSLVGPAIRAGDQARAPTPSLRGWHGRGCRRSAGDNIGLPVSCFQRSTTSIARRCSAPST